MMVEVVRTEVIQLSGECNNVLSEYCHLSKNLWNEANYIVRQEFINNGKWIKYNQLAGSLKESDNYKGLNAQTAQQVLKVLDRSWKSFFRAIKVWKKNPSKFLGMPRLPLYKKKDGEFILIFTNQQVKVKDNILLFPKRYNFTVKIRNILNIREVRIIPTGVGYKCEIVYKKEVKQLVLNKDNVAGIDFGLNNIVTMANNIGLKPIIIKGGFIKSTNQYYNKKKAILQSIYDTLGIKGSKKLNRLHFKRNNKIKDAMHKVSKYVIEYCKSNDIGTLVVGYNENWKQDINIGKRNNQNFVSVPFNTLKNNLEYKASESGIDIIFQEESYTSKCSFLDNESIQFHEKYLGKRINRGTFRTSTNTLINADVNAALNILKKAIPKLDGIEGVVLHPQRINIL